MLPGAVWLAAWDGDVDVIEEWLRDGDVSTTCDFGHTLLHLACETKKNTAKILRAVLAAGPDVNARNSNGDTPLHVAARTCIDSVAGALLLDHGADIDARDTDGCTALMIVNRGTAAHSPQAHCAWMGCLVARGARVDLRDHAGDDALKIAAASKWRLVGPGVVFRERQRLIDMSDEMIEMLHDVRAAGGTWQHFLR